MVKNCEGAEITSFSWANVWARGSCVEAGRTSEAPGSETENWLLAQQPAFASYFHASQVPWGHEKAGPGGCCPHSGFVSQLRIPKFRKPHLSKGGLLRGLTHLCTRHYLFHSVEKINLPCPLEEDPIAVFPGCLLYTHPWKDNQEQKIVEDLQTHHGEQSLITLWTLLIRWVLRHHTYIFWSEHFASCVKGLASWGLKWWWRDQFGGCWTPYK